jgi:enamine deaminase RidA (YjgF/YER057c/UK114 family)
VERKAVNPWEWSKNFGFNQAELVQGHQKVLICSGQTSIDENGAPQHAGDMGAQMTLAFDNLEAVLAEAGMTLANVVRLNIYTTDVDALFEHFPTYAQRMGGVTPCSTLLGVTRLAFPELMLELEVTAMA